MTSWWDFVVMTAGTESPRTLADHTGIDAPNFSKWKAGQIPKPDKVAQFARAYGAPVLQAFIAAGFLTAEEAGQPLPVGEPSYDDIPNDKLLEVLERRLQQAAGQQPSASNEVYKELFGDALGNLNDEKPATPISKKAKMMEQGLPAAEAARDNGGDKK